VSSQLPTARLDGTEKSTPTGVNVIGYREVTTRCDTASEQRAGRAGRHVIAAMPAVKSGSDAPSSATLRLTCASVAWTWAAGP
jgi:hypothetical protein